MEVKIKVKILYCAIKSEDSEPLGLVQLALENIKMLELVGSIYFFIAADECLLMFSYLFLFLCLPTLVCLN